MIYLFRWKEKNVKTACLQSIMQKVYVMCVMKKTQEKEENVLPVAHKHVDRNIRSVSLAVTEKIQNMLCRIVTSLKKRCVKIIGERIMSPTLNGKGKVLDIVRYIVGFVGISKYRPGVNFVERRAGLMHQIKTINIVEILMIGSFYALRVIKRLTCKMVFIRTLATNIISLARGILRKQKERLAILLKIEERATLFRLP